MMRTAALILALTAAAGCRESVAAPAQPLARSVDAGAAAEKALPPPAVPGKQVRGCVVPPPTPARTVAPEDEELYGGIVLGVAGEKPTREQARKAGRELAEETEAHRRQPDSADRLESCAKRLEDVIVANIKLPVDACLDVIEICDPPRFGPGCCPKACLDQVRAYCAANDCSARMAATAVNRTLFAGTCVPGSDRKP